jgi:hypothetical protein
MHPEALFLPLVALTQPRCNRQCTKLGARGAPGKELLSLVVEVLPQLLRRGRWWLLTVKHLTHKCFAPRRSGGSQ